MSEDMNIKSMIFIWLKRILRSAIISFVIALSAFYGAKVWITQWAQTPIEKFAEQDITIKSGDSSHRIIRLLENDSGITQTWHFKLLFIFHPELAKLKVGHYHIGDKPTPNELFRILGSGIEKQFSITFIEGSTFSQWISILDQHPNIDYEQSRISNYIASFEPSSVNESKYIYARVEGQFFPDTYNFINGTKAIDILTRANKELMNKLDQHWQLRDKNIPLTNKKEALVLASIIEKETGIASEREQIASAFVNRLNKRMRLQTDPTVIYGAADDYAGDITYRHLREKNAYNTYKINGLPPTPIAMPSEGAIKAAVNPANTPYIYFVASGDGGHVFNTTLREHQRSTQDYLKKIKQK